MRSIFQCMMEGGYRPSYEKNHILFNIEDNIGVVEYEEGILSVRIFFSIEEGASELFLVASNAAMSETFIVKPVILEDMKHNVQLRILLRHSQTAEKISSKEHRACQ